MKLILNNRIKEFSKILINTIVSDSNGINNDLNCELQLFSEKIINLKNNNNNLYIIGNGGLSLRTVKFIKDILNNFDISKNLTEYQSDNIPEDRYYSKYMQSVGGNIPSITDSLKFSFECKIVNNNANF